LSDGTRASAGLRSQRLSRSLVVAEIALAFALLCVSVSLIANLRSLRRQSAGFDIDTVLTFSFTLPNGILSDGAQRNAYLLSLRTALASVPGVAGVAFANQIPLDGCCLSISLYPEGATAGVDSSISVSFVAVTPSYFETMRIPLDRGRFLT